MGTKRVAANSRLRASKIAQLTCPQADCGRRPHAADLFQTSPPQWEFKFNHLMKLHLKLNFERPGEIISEPTLTRLHGKPKKWSIWLAAFVAHPR